MIIVDLRDMAPRIFRIPNDGSGDFKIEDDIYVAVMGGGYAE